MKIVLLGYCREEVDFIIKKYADQNGALMQRNDFLEDALKEANIKLAELKAKMAEGMTKADADDYKELKIAYAAQQERLDSIVEGLRKLTDEI